MDMSFDIVIKNGRLFDGTGGPWFRGDIAISGDTIDAVGGTHHKDADTVIDAKNLVVCPGFIDIHCHSDFSLLMNPDADSFSRQGITTVINGNCGSSAAPLNENSREALGDRLGINIDWKTLDNYLSKLTSQGIAINTGTYTGLGNLRITTMDVDAWDRTPTDSEMASMKKMLKQSMENGSFGLSSGLEYPPQTIVENWEILELCKVIVDYGGIYSTHIRSRDVKVVAAAKEAIRIGEETGISVQGAHWGARFPSDGKSKFIVDMVVEARDRGVDIAFDQAPWTVDENGIAWCGCSLIEPIAAGSKFTDKRGKITLEMLKDPKVVEFLRRDLPNRQYGPIIAGTRGLLDTWDRFLVSYTENSPQFNGKTLKQIGDEIGKAPFDALIEILVNEGDQFDRAWGAIGFSSRWDTEFSLLHPLGAVAIDSSNDSPNSPLGNQPVGEATTRAYGQLSYFFEKWVREAKALTLEEAIRKCTGLPAQRTRIMDRGLLRPGMFADIVIFNPETIKDTSTWNNPRSYPEGIEKVIVNGGLVVDQNQHTGILRGKVLRLNTK